MVDESRILRPQVPQTSIKLEPATTKERRTYAILQAAAQLAGPADIESIEDEIMDSRRRILKAAITEAETLLEVIELRHV